MYVRLVGDGTSYQRMLTQAQAQTQQVASQVGGAASRIQGFTNTLGGFGQQALGILGSLGVTLSGVGIVRSAVQLAADAEQMEISFSTMLGSARRGQQMVQDLIALANTTPMTLPDVQAGARMLMQFGIEGERIIPTLRMIGDVTGGNAEKFHHLTYAFAEMAGMGHLMGIQLRMMVNAGFNPLEEISRTTGQSMEQLRHEMEAGRISVQMVTDAFRTAAGAGGRFDNLMQRQSQSVAGLFSTMQDSIGSVLRAIGRDIIEQLRLKELMQAFIDLTDPVTAFLQGLSPEVKAVGAAIGIATAAVLAFGLAWQAVGFAVTIATGGLNLVLAGIIGGGVALAVWASRFEVVQNAAAAVWQWMKRNSDLIFGLVATTGPIGMVAAAIYFIASRWETVQRVAVLAWRVTRAAALAFWEWARPYVNEGAAILSSAWTKVRKAGEAAWDFIRIKVGAFVEWVRPIVGAFIGYLSAAWDRAKQVAGDFWKFVTKLAVWAWDGMIAAGNKFSASLQIIWDGLKWVAEKTFGGILSDADLSWKGVQDLIIDAFIAGEFALRHFEDIVKVATAAARYGFVVWSATVAHFFDVVLPAYLGWLSRNWTAAWNDATTNSGMLFQNFIGNVVAVMQNLPGLISGAVDLSDIWTPLTEGFVNTMEGLPQIAGREVGKLEQSLADQRAVQGNALAREFVEFHDQRRREIDAFQFPGLPNLADSPGANAAAREAYEAGRRTGDAFTSAAGKEMQRFDAVLYHSAEAFARVAEFFDRNRPDATIGGARPGHGGAAGGAIPSLAPLNTTPPVQAAPPVAAGDEQWRANVLSALTAIAANTARIAGQPAVQLLPADLP